MSRGGTASPGAADVREGGLAEEGPRAARRVVQGGGMRRVRPCHRAPYQVPDGCLLRLAAGSGTLLPVPPSVWHCAAYSAMRGVKWGSGS